MTASIDRDEYNRQMNRSLERETFSDFIDHFIEFCPEFRERFGRAHAAHKREKIMGKLRNFNQLHANSKDERYHNLIDSLTDLRSEQRKRVVEF